MTVQLFALAFAALASLGSAEHMRSRRLSYERLVGYQPRTQITDHAAIDLDLYEIESELFLGALIKARNVYVDGGHSKSFAEITLINPDGPNLFRYRTGVYGTTPPGGEVSGQLMEEANWGSDSGNVTVKVQYHTSDVQSKYVGCTVGGLYTFKEANRDGCFKEAGKIVFVREGNARPDGTSFDYGYDIRIDNNNQRTLQAFSLQTQDSMKLKDDCSVCPYIDDFQIFLDYYGDTDYADKWVMAASYNTSTDFSHGRGNADFGKFRFKTGLAEAITKGIINLNVFMYVIHELEDGLYYCEESCGTDDERCHDYAVHGIDKALAFYAGSLEGEDGRGDGKMLYDSADKMALHFKTAGEFGMESEGTAFINQEVVREFKKAQLYVLQGQCDLARDAKKEIVNYMKVPLVQGILRYAYIREFEKPGNKEDAEKADAEGASYAAALLPYLHKCDPDSATVVYRSMKIGSSAAHFADVKAALEKNYGCLNIQCEQVGGIWTVNGYASGAEPCGSGGPPNTESRDSATSNSSNVGMAVGVTVAVVLALVLGAFLFVRMRRSRRTRSEKAEPNRRSSGNIAAVSEIS